MGICCPTRHNPNINKELTKTASNQVQTSKANNSLNTQKNVDPKNKCNTITQNLNTSKYNNNINLNTSKLNNTNQNLYNSKFNNKINLNDSKLDNSNQNLNDSFNNINLGPLINNNTNQNLNALKFNNLNLGSPINNNTNQNCRILKNNNFNLNLNNHSPVDIHKSYNYKNYNNFPRYTIYEKGLNSNFKYFNIFWYDPYKTNDFAPFIKCFENVQFYTDDTLISIVNFFRKESIYEWIVITPGSRGKELITSLENFECIKSFFIYCRFPTDYNWAKNIKKVGCITSDPKIICQKLIGINKTYIIPDFNYKTKSNDNNILLNYNKNDSENKIYFNCSILNKLMESKNKIKNKYNIFCIKLLHYLSSNEILNDIKKAISEGTNLFTIFLKLNFKIDSEFLQEMINILKQYCFLSLYFHNYPYLFNLFSLQEIKDLIIQGYINDQEDDELSKSYMNDFSLLRSSNIAKKLNQKILNNECILDNKNELKKLHIFLLQHISNSIRFSFGDVRNFFNYYQIANYLRDFDICLILGIQQLILFINNKKYNFVDELYISLLSSNSRYPTYCMYLGFLTYQKIFPNSLFKENQSVIYESLTIKDFIVVGDIIFHKKIKPIEKYIKFKSFRYMRIEEISNYLNLRKIAERKTIYTYFYFLIIGFKEFRKNLENIILLSFKTGITFCVFLYIENDEAKKISKNYINLILPTILVYSPQDILNYLSQKFN